MSKQYILKSTLLSVLVCICLTLSGCTAAMFTLGAISDSQAPKEKTIPGSQIGSVKVGNKAFVFTNQGTSFNAIYQGLIAYSQPEYARLYEQAKTSNPEAALIPSLSDRIIIKSGYGNIDKVNFFGFDYRYHKSYSPSRIQNDAQSYLIQVSSSDKGIRKQLPLTKIEWVINQNGDTLKGSSIRALILNNQLPTNNSAEFKVGSKITSIQFAQIDSVRVSKSNNSKWVLGAIGLVVDIALYIKFSRKFAEPFDWGYEGQL
jgi:hypothetical protein